MRARLAALEAENEAAAGALAGAERGGSVRRAAVLEREIAEPWPGLGDDPGDRRAGRAGGAR